MLMFILGEFGLELYQNGPPSLGIFCECDLTQNIGKVLKYQFKK